MNAVWLLILVSGIIAMLAKTPEGAISAMLDGANGAVKLALTLTASYAFWLGFFKLLEASGISALVSRALRPLVRRLFKGASPETERFVTCNMSANLLGLGNAATPIGIGAVGSMNDGSGRATDNMIMLVVISATSLQLIPTTVIGMRIAHGSASPTSFLLPCIAATVSSTVIGVLLCKLCAFIERKIQFKRKNPRQKTPPREKNTAAFTEKNIKSSAVKNITAAQRKNVTAPREKKINSPARKNATALPGENTTAAAAKNTAALPGKNTTALPEKNINILPRKNIKSAAGENSGGAGRRA